MFNASNDNVSVGDAVRITGVVAEFQGQTQISFPDVLTVLSTGNTLPTASTVTLPFAALDSLEAVEGMLVTFPQTLYVTEFFQLGRFGEVLVSSGDRLPQPTANVAPGAPAQAMQAANDLNQLIIDDALQQPERRPDRVRRQRGAADGGQPAARRRHRHRRDRRHDVHVGRQRGVGQRLPAAAGDRCRSRFQAGEPASRPSAPDVGGSLKVASFNVLNYFLTLDDGGNGLRPGGEQAGVPRCRDGRWSTSASTPS